MADSGRYQDLCDVLNGIANKVLTRRCNGLITWQLEAKHVETATLYELTDLGRSLGEELAAFGRRGKVNRAHVESVRQRYQRQTGG